MGKAALPVALGLLVISAATTAWGGVSPLENAITVPSDASPGERLYILEGCYQCHGYEGQGSILSGPSLVPMSLSSEAFRAYVRNPARAMPPYSHETLPEADLALIEEYVRGFPQPRSITDVPALARFAVPEREGKATKSVPPIAPRQDDARLLANGRAVYRAHCAQCHGAELQGGIAPGLAQEAGKRDGAETVAMIRNPPSTMPALFPDPLSAAEVDAVAAFIRSR